MTTQIDTHFKLQRNMIGEARAVRAETAHTALGEAQAVAAHAAFALAPTLVMLLVCACFYYARMKDRGVTDIGFGGSTQVPAALQTPRGRRGGGAELEGWRVCGL